MWSLGMWHTENEGCTFLWNIGSHLPDYKVLYTIHLWLLQPAFEYTSLLRCDSVLVGVVTNILKYSCALIFKGQAVLLELLDPEGEGTTILFGTTCPVTVSHLRRHCSTVRTQNPNTTFSYLPFTLHDDPSCYIFYLPLMQPGNLCLMAVSMSSSDIQLPRVPLTPAFGVGMASWRSLVHMNVRLSTRATSAGLVRASQLNVEEI